jgi:galactokinase/mevalonate kinase-like predicted kinase
MTSGLERLGLSHSLHSLGTAILGLNAADPAAARRVLGEARRSLSPAQRAELAALGVPATAALWANPRVWARAAHDAAFENIGRTIVLSRERAGGHPKNSLRSDEIVWGRAPARLDLGGGWSDTPPYSLEHGGRVINAAVDLNGQPPIHVYARVVPAPEIHINSIDHGARTIIRSLDQLLDYRSATSGFALAKAALALAGFSPDAAEWPSRARTLEAMLRAFGGGIELTTLAAIPSGSGLGTSSIVGAVIASVVHRLFGRTLSARELFHFVLRLEQELTTGGGWQDQIGGVVPGVKVITARPGLIPDPKIQAVAPDVLDPAANGGRTLLYYTGLRRLAKNILRNVVGNYLDGEPNSLRTLRELHAFPPGMRAAMERRDMAEFGRLIDVAWSLNKRIDPASSTSEVEAILDRLRPHMFGAKLLGAGGGGFLLVVCKSAKDAREARRKLESRPPNPRARFFEFGISRDGLCVTVC